MSHRLDSLLLRGVFGATLSLAVLVGAASQAVGFQGEWRFENGRLVLETVAESQALCQVETEASLRRVEGAPGASG
jgi:hypothetical protein